MLDKLSSSNQKELPGYQIDAIVAEMNNHSPQSKFSNGASYNQIAKHYLDICVMELLNNLDDNQQISEISLTNLKNQFTYRYNRTNYWWDFLFKNYPTEPSNEISNNF